MSESTEATTGDKDMAIQIGEALACNPTPTWPFATLCLFVADTQTEFDEAPDIINQYGAGSKRIGDLVLSCVPKFVRDKLVGDGMTSKTPAEVSTMLFNELDK